MRFKYAESNTADPYRNLAFEEALLSLARPDEILIFLWQNENTIVVGRNQDAYRECKVNDFISSGGQVARRRSGGGAVYHDLGNLNFSIISHRKADYGYQQLICSALDRFSIRAAFNGRNDMLVEGRKFSGNAVYMDGDLVCQHGTILINTDLGKMARFLTPEESKLDRNHIKSVSSRVVNLCEADRTITVERCKEAIIQAVKAMPFEIAPKRDVVDRLEAFYRDETWIYSGRRTER